MIKRIKFSVKTISKETALAYTPHTRTHAKHLAIKRLTALRANYIAAAFVHTTHARARVHTHTAGYKETNNACAIFHTPNTNTAHCGQSSRCLRTHNTCRHAHTRTHAHAHAHEHARAHAHPCTHACTQSTQSTKNGYKDTNNACAIFLIVGVHTKHVHGTLRVNYVVAAFAFREQLCGDDFHTETLDRFSQLSEKES